MTALLQYETGLRLGVFAAVLVLMAILEALWPRRARTLPRAHRWSTNLLMVVVDSLVIRIAFPIAAAGMAIYAQAKGWGVLNQIAMPDWLTGLILIVLMDFLIYVQHVASHHIPVLWALHKVHHADRDIDVTTGNRFHPFEIMASLAFKLFCVAALGGPVWAVIVFEIVLNASAMFNHANLKLPASVDGVLRRIIVTPDMHRVHHSAIPSETNSNYGFFLSVWDRLFKTYIAQPKNGHENMIIGLSDYQSPGPASLLWSLALPFKATKRLSRWL